MFLAARLMPRKSNPEPRGLKPPMKRKRLSQR